MNKPNGYDETQIFGEYETLQAGGYKCLIKKVELGKSQQGKEFLKIAFDIAEGEHKDFYQRKFDSDKRQDKKWAGTWAVFVDGYNPGTTNPKFKGLITAIEESNTGFKFDFNEKTLEGKKVGIVFREEEFLGQNDGRVHSATKPFYATSYDKAEEAKVPNKKAISPAEGTMQNNAQENYNSMLDLDAIGDDLPF